MGWQLGLERVSKLLFEMGKPHLRFKSVLIAGTNGKGSTAAMIDSICRQAGYKTGLYTSPHLVHVTERIRVNGVQISLEKLTSYIQQIREKVEEIGCTYFEVLTAIAFQCFADSAVDLAILEVGLGGRFDATNVVNPVLSIITEIDLDHTEYLGSTKAKIAQEKGGIIKPNSHCLAAFGTNVVRRVFKEIADNRGAFHYQLQDLCSVQVQRLTPTDSEFSLQFRTQRFRDLRLGLAGGHQVRNATLAVAACKILSEQGLEIDSKHIYTGLESINWPGRLELFQTNPRLVLDVAHNVGAIRKLVQALKSIYGYDRLFFVLGLLRDKNFQAVSKIVAEAGDWVYVVSPSSERALSAKILGEELAKHSVNFVVCENIEDGIQRVKDNAGRDDLICVTGSHYLVGEFLSLQKENFYKNS